MPNVIFYLCDQKKRPCRDYCQMGLSSCRHTLDTDHAINGEIDPEKVQEYPDRFAYIRSETLYADNKPAYVVDYYEEKVTEP